uniref:LOW QUALITY PROTEIN: glucose-6-phosphate exchanger SLC37A2-like n=1 Tax=Petromyzon marinus TaxID=7757 RepID=A0AAJ7XA59_PETMA|nr:LOW QUALITY PROTEIN: glucose-6-phosphate exchanger SLC37A2-like [Petromyzon marinus]
MGSVPPGIRLLRRFTSDQWHRGFILVLTFFLYAAFHMSRKPISIVKSQLHKNCSAGMEPFSFKENLLFKENNETWCDWKPFDRSNYKELLGALDYSFLGAYAIGMFLSGVIGERVPMRLYLTVGMVLSGFFTILFGLGFFWKIHSLPFYIVVQVLNGLVQTTGWPSVIACIGNWFGKGRRGFIMGVWNSHTSVGNIVGSLIAGVWVSTSWGYSFVVPGIIMTGMGLVCFLFLIEHPEDVGCSPPQHHMRVLASVESQGNPAVLQDGDREPLLAPISGINEETSITSLHAGALPGGASDGGEGGARGGGAPRAISFMGALRIPGVIEFSLCLLFSKLVSYTFLYWLPLYISNQAHFDSKSAGDLSTLFDVGGILGGILAGVVSDAIGGRATTCGVMLLLAAPMLFVYNSVGYQNMPTHHRDAGVVWGTGERHPTLSSPPAVSADLGTHKSLKGNARALHTVSAIIDGTVSIGAALGPLLAGLISPLGWDNVFSMLMGADACACLLLIRLMYKEIRGWCGCVEEPARLQGALRRPFPSQPPSVQTLGPRGPPPPLPRILSRLLVSGKTPPLRW